MGVLAEEINSSPLALEVLSNLTSLQLGFESQADSSEICRSLRDVLAYAENLASLNIKINTLADASVDHEPDDWLRDLTLPKLRETSLSARDWSRLHCFETS